MQIFLKKQKIKLRLQSLTQLNLINSANLITLIKKIMTINKVKKANNEKRPIKLDSSLFRLTW
jgi:hypothetical protein